MSGTNANRYAGIAWHRNRLITGTEPGKMVRNRRKNRLSTKPPTGAKRHMRRP